jgi:4a-hydroxytetrahydrobiopterin dehydratase
LKEFVVTEALSRRRCKPCEGGAEPLTTEQSESLLQALHSDWSISGDGQHIMRTVKFPDYGRTLGFANAVAWIATCEDHHPALTISYSSCRISYTTHAIGGLSDNDFICAAKIDQLVQAPES